MTVTGRLGALVSVSGVVILFLDNPYSVPNLWNGTGMIIVGAVLVTYRVLIPPVDQRRQSAPGTVSSSKSATGNAVSSMDSTSSQQTTEPTEISKEQSAAEDNSETPEPASSSDVRQEPSSTPVEHRQSLGTADWLPLQATTQTEATHTRFHALSQSSSHTRTPVGVSTQGSRDVAATSSQRGYLSSGGGNKYFKPIESSYEHNLFDIDMRVSYVDLDGGLAGVELDLAPDLVEIDIGPSAMSQELVRSPVQLKISSFIKSLFAPSPRYTDTGSHQEATGFETAVESYSRSRTDKGNPEQRQTIREAQSTSSQEQHRAGEHVNEPVEFIEGNERPVDPRPQLPSQRFEESCHPSADMAGYVNGEETVGSGQSQDSFLPGQESLRVDDLDNTGDSPRLDDLVSKPAIDESQETWSEPCQVPSDSLSQLDPPRLDPNAVGQVDLDCGFDDLGEPAVDAVEPFPMVSQEESASGFNQCSWEPYRSIDEPSVDSRAVEDVFETGGFFEEPEDSIEAPDPIARNRSEQLLPDAEPFAADEDLSEDWPSS
ncbi:hypothetical protein [Halosimplex pelagicum]|uniref:Uncharacterized protein n=1 Tax=Halosimplex pelagicum TaxID=869886 RepID=A0A7D5PFP1_9EURY|nr:hypothetical protein [Halosimplex pelagicum]QLH82999.1 hypothetical protein HZS54_15800 [Halosimplex pelagicum]